MIGAGLSLAFMVQMLGLQSRLALLLRLERFDIKSDHQTEYNSLTPSSFTFMLGPERLRLAAPALLHSLAAYRSELAFLAEKVLQQRYIGGIAWPGMNAIPTMNTNDNPEAT